MSYQVVLKSEFHGSIDAWTEYLCLEILPDRRVAITSRMAGRSDPALREAWLEIQATLSTGYHDPFLGCCLPR